MMWMLINCPLLNHLYIVSPLLNAHVLIVLPLGAYGEFSSFLNDVRGAHWPTYRMPQKATMFWYKHPVEDHVPVSHRYRTAYEPIHRAFYVWSTGCR